MGRGVSTGGTLADPAAQLDISIIEIYFVADSFIERSPGHLPADLNSCRIPLTGDLVGSQADLDAFGDRQTGEGILETKPETIPAASFEHLDHDGMHTGLNSSKVGIQHHEILDLVCPTAATADTVDPGLLVIEQDLDCIIAAERDIHIHVVLEDDVDKGVHHEVAEVPSVEIIEVDRVIIICPEIPGRYAAGIDGRGIRGGH